MGICCPTNPASLPGASPFSVIPATTWTPRATHLSEARMEPFHLTRRGRPDYLSTLEESDQNWAPSRLGAAGETERRPRLPSAPATFTFPEERQPHRRAWASRPPFSPGPYLTRRRHQRSRTLGGGSAARTVREGLGAEPATRSAEVARQGG